MKHLIIAITAVFFAGPFAAAQSGGVAFVDLDYVITQMPEGKVVAAERKARVQGHEYNISGLTKTLEDMMQAYARSELTASEASLKMQQEQISKMRSEIETAQYAAEADIAQWTSSENSKLKALARDEVKRLRAERGLIAVLELDGVIAADPAADLTQVVVERLGGSPE